MKKILNNISFLSFFSSGIVYPYLAFCLIDFTNHYLFLQKNFIDYNWRYFYAFWGGFNRDLFIFSFITLFLGIICKYIPILKKLSIVLLHITLFLPLIDYFYFRATLERFNWIVLNFINFHSSKGFIGNMGMEIICLLLLFIIAIFVSIYLSNRKTSFIEKKFIKPLTAICIFTFFSSLFASNVCFPIESNFTGHKRTVEGKNRILKDLYSGSIFGFLYSKQNKTFNNKFKEYSSKERLFLETNGFLPTKQTQKTEAKFDRLIMIVLESFALEYLHCVNPDIPAEASPYLDYLMNNYPHLKNFYTSDFPTLQGLNAILSSKIPFNENNHNKQKHNLAHLFESKYPNSTWFLRGSSRVYGNEEITISKVFGFSNFIGYEDLAKKYPEPQGYVWGYMDNILYSEALNIISQINREKYFMIIDLLNQHQPISYSITEAKNLPSEVKNHKNDIVKAIYDADRLIKQFVNICEENNILDERTLLMITADHYPPLGYGHKELIKDKQSHFQLGKLPLIFVTSRKDIFKNLKSNTLCCQLDLAPTLCELLGLESSDEYIGQSLLSSKFEERSIGLLNNQKLYYQSDSFEFVENLSEPATTTIVIQKWINNLTSHQDSK